MAFQLQTLLDLRRNAESEARVAFDRAIAAHAKEKEEQARLVAIGRAACGALDEEVARRAAGPAPTTAAEARTRALFHDRLHEEASTRARCAENHRASALAAALAAEDEARTCYEEAHKACQAVEKLKDHAEAEEKKDAERKAEIAAGDLAQAAYFKRKSE
jgi:flagellar biosynthesis chaperone FliJ